jgi:hypothetical protein
MDPDDLVAAMDRERDNEDAALYLGKKVSFVHISSFFLAILSYRKKVSFVETMSRFRRRWLR